MDRRRFVALAGSALIAPRALAQARVYRVGWLSAGPAKGPGSENVFLKVFLAELRRLGFTEGVNLVLEYRGVDGDFARADQAMRELLQAKVDVIYAAGNRLARPAKALVRTIPVVFVAYDPVRDGLVESLARPGKNFTGISSTPGQELEAKRLQLLKEALPAARRVAFLGAPFEWNDPFSGLAVRDAAKVLGITISLAECEEKDVSSGLERIARDRPDAAFVPASIVMYVNRRKIGEFMRAKRIPSSHGFEESVEAGGLMSYGVHMDDMARKVAEYVAKMLKGADPATTPVERSSTFRTVINLRVARELGIAIPEPVLLRADRVIE